MADLLRQQHSARWAWPAAIVTFILVLIGLWRFTVQQIPATMDDDRLVDLWESGDRGVMSALRRGMAPLGVRSVSDEVYARICADRGTPLLIAAIDRGNEGVSLNILSTIREESRLDAVGLDAALGSGMRWVMDGAWIEADGRILPPDAVLPMIPVLLRHAATNPHDWIRSRSIVTVEKRFSQAITLAGDLGESAEMNALVDDWMNWGLDLTKSNEQERKDWLARATEVVTRVTQRIAAP